jgi:hypothetical protein
MTKFVTPLNRREIVISMASASRVNILGTQSQHLPQESNGTLLFGVPSNLVGLGVMPASRGRCCIHFPPPIIFYGQAFDERCLAQRMSATTDTFCSSIIAKAEHD